MTVYQYRCGWCGSTDIAGSRVPLGVAHRCYRNKRRRELPPERIGGLGKRAAIVSEFIK